MWILFMASNSLPKKCAPQLVTFILMFLEPSQLDCKSQEKKRTELLNTFMSNHEDRSYHCKNEINVTICGAYLSDE